MFPSARIKKLMLINEEVGKMANTVPAVVGRACELLLRHLLQQCNGDVKDDGAKPRKTITTSALRLCIGKHDKFKPMRPFMD